MGLPGTATKPLQMIQCSSTSGLQSVKKNICHTPPDLTPLTPSCGQNQITKVLTLDSRIATGTAHPYLNTLLQVYAPFCQIRSLNEWCQKITCQNLNPLCSFLVEWTANLHLTCWDHIFQETAEQTIFCKHLTMFANIQKMAGYSDLEENLNVMECADNFEQLSVMKDCFRKLV